jgi:chromosome segregation ATPase
MSEISKSFNQLEGNLKALISRKSVLEQELEKIKVENKEFAEELISYKREIEDLKEKNKILRIAGGTNDGDSREIKLKINEIVREVDKCIAQLNQ